MVWRVYSVFRYNMYPYSNPAEQSDLLQFLSPTSRVELIVLQYIETCEWDKRFNRIKLYNLNLVQKQERSETGSTYSLQKSFAPKKYFRF